MNIQIGEKFNHLTIVDIHGVIKGKTHVIAKCDCGMQKNFPWTSIKTGRTVSCGCRKFVVRTHGLSKHPLYKTWDGMMQRCNNKNNPRYHDYGGRGIAVCERWHNPANFFEDMVDKPHVSYELERKNNNGNYDPDNVIWATRATNSLNKRSSVFVVHNGASKILSVAAKDSGINEVTLRGRYYAGDSDLFRPVKAKNKKCV